MKKQILAFLSSFILAGAAFAQTYTPVSVTGFNVDAVAEDQPCSSLTTVGGIDIQHHVMYSAYYGTLYSSGTGLPDNGTITSGSSTYQLQDYTQNNVLYMTAGQTDSLVLTTPATFTSISLLGFATETASSNTFTLEFTDGSVSTFNNISLQDWFGGSGAILAGFDRTVQTSGTPQYTTTDPRLYATNLTLACPDQLKLLRTIVVTDNSSGTPRTCIMAVSGVAGTALSLTSTNPSCAGSSDGSATVTASGGTGSFTYSWNSSPAQYSSSATGLPAGIYTVSVSSGSCIFPLHDTLVAGSAALLPNITASANPVCSGAPVTLTTGSAAHYTWSAGSSTDSVNIVNPTTTTTYTVTITNSTGCSGIGTKTITVYTAPTITYAAAPSASVCGGGTVTLTGSGGVSYTWSGGVVNGIAFSPSASTTYSVTGTDANNCSSTANAYISVNPAPHIGIIAYPSDTVCGGSALQLSGLRATTYHWSDNVSDDTAFIATANHTYTVTGTDANGCVGTASVDISVRSNPTVTATATPSATVCYGSPVTLTASGSATTYSWSDNVVNGVAFSPQVIGTYSVTATDANGCYSTAAVDINVKICATGIDEVGTFTRSVYPNPNNGSFNISVNTYITNMGIEVFDVRGRKVYASSESNVQAGDVKQISLSNASSGLYFLRLSDGSESHVTKITIE